MKKTEIIEKSIAIVDKRITDEINRCVEAIDRLELLRETAPDRIRACYALAKNEKEAELALAVFESCCL